MTTREIISFQMKCRATHVAWIRYFTKYPELHKKALVSLVGTKRSHEQLVAKYDATINLLRADDRRNRGIC